MLSAVKAPDAGKIQAAAGYDFPVSRQIDGTPTLLYDEAVSRESIYPDRVKAHSC